jgi:cytochrome c2
MSRKRILAGFVSFLAVVQGQTAPSKSGSHHDESQKACPPRAYNQDAHERLPDTATMPADVKAGYKMFRSKCAECHSLNDRFSVAGSSAQDWTDIVYRMQDMASSHMNESQSKAIIKFLIWDADFSDEMVKTLMAFDKDGDGKLSRSEVPERMQGLFDRGDTNKDGFLTREEIRKLASTQGTAAMAAGSCDGEHPDYAEHK